MANYSAIKYNFNLPTGTTNGSGNSIELIKTLTASSSGTLSFVNGASSVVLDSTYKTYLFKFINIHASGDEVDLQVGFRDGGTAYDATKTTTYFEAIHDEGDSTAQVSYIAGLDIAQGTGFQTILRYLGNDNDESSSGEMFLFNPSSTTFVKHFQSESITLTTNGYVNHLHVAGYCNVTAAIDAVQFKMASGEIQGGTIQVFGVS